VKITALYVKIIFQRSMNANQTMTVLCRSGSLVMIPQTAPGAHGLDHRRPG
jgi:hypothetical protein